MRAIRIFCRGPNLHEALVSLDGIMLPGVQRVEVVMDARSGEAYAWLRFGYVDLDLDGISLRTDPPLGATLEGWRFAFAVLSAVAAVSVVCWALLEAL